MSGHLRQRISFRLHQWLGLCSAIVLLIVGASGALLALEKDIVALWPTPEVAVSGPLLPMPELNHKLAMPGKALQRIYLEPELNQPGRALYQDRQTKQRQWQLFNPYTGELLGPRPGISEFFADVMALHRWLLLPNSVGSVITGSATIMAFFLLITGLLRRAPDKLASIKDWLWWKRGSRGRLALWQFHAVLGTWLFIPIAIMVLTGPWYAFNWYRDGLKQLLASPQAALVTPKQAPVADDEALWRNFLAVKADGRYARWFLPRGENGVVRVSYLAPDAPHSHAFSTLTFDAAGNLLQQRRYHELQGGDYLLANMYALHTGSYFGAGGRWLWALSGLAFASFAVTGLWLFFSRRARPREQASGNADTLIAYASQSGTAAAHGQQLQQWLQSCGTQAHLRAMTQIQPEDFAAYRQVLLLAATYGEGDAPDSALAFQQRLATAAVSYHQVNVAVLAFGDRQYQQFCAFGHWLAQRFTQLGATTLLPLQEVDRGAEHTLSQWQQSLARKLMPQHVAPTVPATSAWQQATLLQRTSLNPGSGREIHHLLLDVSGAWQPGDILEVLPCWDEWQSRQYLQALGLDGDAMVCIHEGEMPLWQAQAHYLETAPMHREEGVANGVSAQQYADMARPLAPRSYSIASMASPLALMVRQVIKADGNSGRASTLLATAKAGSHWQVRIKPHEDFHLPATDVPLILLATGTGLAPFLGFLQQRAQQQARQPLWLLFGERHAEQDNYYGRELQRFVDDGIITHLDFAWSREASGPQAPQHGPYVQDYLVAGQARLQEFLRRGAHIYVCGAINGVGAGVTQTLTRLLGKAQLQALQQQGRYHRDLY
ncbi:PepSY domain-containing protein [Shewanella sp. YIC-542]|uniref:PepSY domain-containing protein n=1 Tax=Shewanella mytili TaxID=3377111 RepID=UPI00398F8048